MTQQSESHTLKVMADTYRILMKSVMRHLLETAGDDPYIAQSLALMAAERLRCGSIASLQYREAAQKRQALVCGQRRTQ